MRTPLALLLLLAATLALAAPQAPDLVIVNARVFTGVDSQPWAEAIAVAGERISHVGTTADIRARAGATTRVVDAEGRLVIPGINDAHVHIGAMPPGTQLEGPPPMEHDPTLAEIQARVKAAAGKAPAGQWIFGAIGAVVLEDPKATRFALDDVAPGHTVALTSWTGHGTLYNTAALRRLGVTDEELDPAGGFFVRMPGSRTVSGLVHEYADFILRQRISAEAGGPAQIAAAREFGQAAAAFGITSLQSMGTTQAIAETTATFTAAALPQRVRLIDFPMTGITAWQGPASREARGGDRITVSGTKWIMDGTPIERLMFLREPYADRPDTRGQLNFPPADLAAFLRRAMETREQPMLHITGDAGIDAFLDALEQTGGERWQALRPRLEHGDLLGPSHFARARRVGVILVQNPSHFMIPAIAGTRLGPRAERAWMMKATIEAGVPVALGSDGPLNPFLNVMFASLLANNPAQAMTREQALLAYTRGAAFAEFQEQQKGTIAPGMLADLAMLSQDIFTVPPDALPGTTSLLTLVGGTVIHEGR
jgi:predicted amidohydrolase YtcJ